MPIARSLVDELPRRPIALSALALGLVLGAGAASGEPGNAPPPGTVDELTPYARLFLGEDGADVIYAARDGRRFKRARLDRALSRVGEPTSVPRAAPGDVVVDPSGHYFVARAARGDDRLMVSRCAPDLTRCADVVIPAGDGAVGQGRAVMVWHPRVGEHALVVEESMKIEGRSGFRHTRLVFFRVSEDGRLVEGSRRVLHGPGGPYEGSALSGTGAVLVSTSKGYALVFQHAFSGTRPHEVVLLWLGRAGEVLARQTLDRDKSVLSATLASRPGAVLVAWVMHDDEGRVLRVTQIAAGARQSTLEERLPSASALEVRLAPLPAGFGMAWAATRGEVPLQVLRVGEALPDSLDGAAPLDDKAVPRLLLDLAGREGKLAVAYSELGRPPVLVVRAVE